MYSNVVAALQPPNLAAYGTDYEKYLGHFDKFLGFLNAHVNIVSADTQKPFRFAPMESVDKTLHAVRNAMSTYISPDKKEKKEDGVATPATSHTISLVDTESMLFSNNEKFNKIGQQKSKNELVLPEFPDGDYNPYRKDSEGCILFGKKKVKKMLLELCTPALADHLIGTDKVSRVPGRCESQIAYLRRKKEKNGAVLLDLDKAAADAWEKRTTPGRIKDTEWDDLWLSGSGDDQ